MGSQMAMRLVCVLCLMAGGVSCADMETSRAGVDDTGAEPDNSPDPVDFDVICADVMCDADFWFDGEYERGDSTWHDHDAAFRLTGDPVILSVVDEEAGAMEFQPDCYVVTVMANTEEDARLYLEVDMGHDGQRVYREDLGELSWSTVSREFLGPSEDMPVLFRIVKENAGNAGLYFMKVSGNFTCSEEALLVKP